MPLISTTHLAAALGLLLPATSRGSLLEGVSWASHGDASRVGIAEDPLGPFTIDVGDAKVHFMTQGAVTTKAEFMFPFLAGDNQSLAAFPDGLVRLEYGCVLVQVGGKTILLDTSVDAADTGAFGSPPWTTVRPYESLMTSLDALSVAAGDIDGVVISHMHRDHTGWAIEDGVPHFSNAQYYFQSTEVAYWNVTNPGRVVWDDNLQPLFDAGQVSQVDGDGGADELAPGLQVLAWGGHTPGHQVVKIKSGEAVAYYVGDAIHVEQQLARPDWGPFFDWAPTMAASQRRSLLQKIADEKALLLSPHFPFPGWGYIQADGNGGFMLTKTEPGKPEATPNSFWEAIQPFALVALGLILGLLGGYMCLGQDKAHGEKAVEVV